MKICFYGFHLSYYDNARTRSDFISTPTYPISEEHSKVCSKTKTKSKNLKL